MPPRVAIFRDVQQQRPGMVALNHGQYLTHTVTYSNLVASFEFDHRFSFLVSHAPIISSTPPAVHPNRHAKFYFVKVVVTYCHVRTYVDGGSPDPAEGAPSSLYWGFSRARVLQRVGFFNLTCYPSPGGLYRRVVQTK